MKRVYLDVCNLILKGENSMGKTRLELNTLGLVKYYNINGKEFIYVKDAIHEDGLIRFLSEYRAFNVKMIIPTGIVGECSKTILTERFFDNMMMIYEDTRLEGKCNDGKTLILCNEEKASLEEIQFILNDVKKNKELEDVLGIFRKVLLKGMTFRIKEKENKSKEEIMKSIEEELIKNNNKILKKISEELNTF